MEQYIYHIRLLHSVSTCRLYFSQNDTQTWTSHRSKYQRLPRVPCSGHTEATRTFPSFFKKWASTRAATPREVADQTQAGRGADGKAFKIGTRNAREGKPETEEAAQRSWGINSDDQEIWMHFVPTDEMLEQWQMRRNAETEDSNESFGQQASD